MISYSYRISTVTLLTQIQHITKVVIVFTFLCDQLTVLQSEADVVLGDLVLHHLAVPGPPRATLAFLDSKKLMGRFGLDSNKVAEGYLTKLGKEGILRTEEEVDGTYAIVKEKIDEAMKRYFGIKPKEEKLVAMVDKMTKNLEIDNKGDRRSKLKRTRNAAAEERNNSHNDRLGLDEEDNVVAQGSRSPRDER